MEEKNTFKTYGTCSSHEPLHVWMIYRSKLSANILLKMIKYWTEKKSLSKEKLNKTYKRPEYYYARPLKKITRQSVSTEANWII